MTRVAPLPEVFIPDGVDPVSAFKRTAGGGVGIGAHPDDLEIMAVHGIGLGFNRSDQMFTGITVTDGRGSARKGGFAAFSDDQMAKIRHGEQIEAAKIGKYSAQFQLQFQSDDIKGANPVHGEALVQRLFDILLVTQPKTIYMHNPFDEHESHNAVARATIMALRRLPADKRPANVYGCEVWGGLDWVTPERKVALDVSAYTALQKRLIACHNSQIEGSKNYIRATLGREFGHATYTESHKLDSAMAMNYALDLRPLVDNSQLSFQEFARQHIDAMAAKILARAGIYEPKP